MSKFSVPFDIDGTRGTVDFFLPDKLAIGPEGDAVKEGKDVARQVVGDTAAKLAKHLAVRVRDGIAYTPWESAQAFIDPIEADLASQYTAQIAAARREAQPKPESKPPAKKSPEPGTTRYRRTKPL
jgi:hypothetical protein